MSGGCVLPLLVHRCARSKDLLAAGLRYWPAASPFAIQQSSCRLHRHPVRQLHYEEWLEMRTQDTFPCDGDRKSGVFVGLPTKPLGHHALRLLPGPPRHGARNKQKKKGILLSAQVQSDQTDSLVVSVYRRSRILDRAFFEHFGFAAPEKILLFASGSLSREGISYEEDGSSDASNSGASERRVNLFLCGRRGSDPHVLAGTLQRELIRKLR